MTDKQAALDAIKSAIEDIDLIAKFTVEKEISRDGVLFPKEQAIRNVCGVVRDKIVSVRYYIVGQALTAPAVLLHTVYVLDDDFTHIFSTEKLAKEFADTKECPCVISTYLIDNPERFYEAVQ